MSPKKKRKKKDIEISKGRLWWRNSLLRKAWKPIAGGVWAVFLPTLGFVIRIYYWTLDRGLKTERRGPLFDYIREGKPCIVTIWHDDPFASMVEFFRHTKTYKTLAMASGGRTGRMGGYLLGLWGIKAVYGSSSGGGIEAVDRLTKKVRERGVSVVMSADGSRGPLYVAKWGAIYLARNTGLPVIGIRGWAQHNVSLSWSWTKLALPIPFGRHVALSTEPLFVPPDADKEELERCRQELERRMNVQKDLAFRLVRGEKL